MDKSRRRFIRMAGQGLFLAGTLGVAVSVLTRNEGDGACDFDFICKNCRKKTDCSLPEARNFRELKIDKEL